LWNLVSGKGEKGSEHSATVALPSPFVIYNGHFELGLGQSTVRLSIYFIYAYAWRQTFFVIKVVVHFACLHNLNASSFSAADC
jgi:hypothetical protein